MMKALLIVSVILLTGCAHPYTKLHNADQLEHCLLNGYHVVNFPNGDIYCINHHVFNQ